MGSTARIYLHDAPDGLAEVLSLRLDELERRWSRFLPDSEVSLANGAAGRPVAVSTDTVLLVGRAVTAARITGGWFDSMLLEPLRAAGYDRTFGELDRGALPELVVTVVRHGPVRSEPGARAEAGFPLRGSMSTPGTPPEATTASPPGSARVTVLEAPASARLPRCDVDAGTVVVPPGSGFDPGGIGKGLAADLLAAEAVDAGAGAALIDLGGDVACGGLAPDGGWPVDIEDPFRPGEPITRLHVPWGAVATSSATKRRWMNDAGDVAHHLIDPATHRPADSGLASVTVVAGACWLAEVCAKAALVAGLETGTEILAANGVEALLIDDAGGIHLTPGMAGFVS